MSGPRERTPEEQRRGLACCAAISFLATLAWCFAMFWTRQPAIDYFCILGFTPLILAVLWAVLGWQALTLMRRHPPPGRKRWIVVIVLSFLLAPYVVLRAGSDVFTLSLRYHLSRAGGAEKVRDAFNQWVATRPVFDPGTGRKLLFREATADRKIVPLPVTELPPEVRYMREQFPSRFGTTRNDVAYLDNVSVLTTTDIMIGPPGWEPDGGLTIWHRIAGSRRKLGDGIWVAFGKYDK